MSASSPAVNPDPADEGRIDRIASASARDTLDRIANAETLGSGVINMIGLDAIRRELGDRWTQKAPRVWEHLERELERVLSPSDIFVRLDDSNYLIAQPGEDGFAAQALCLGVLQEALKFFLGELRPADISVRSVTSIEGGVIASSPVDPARLRRRLITPEPEAPARVASGMSIQTPAERAADAATGPLADHVAPAENWRPPLAGRSSLISLTPIKRPPFDIQLCVEPVWNLKRGIISSFLIDRSGAPDALDAADLEEMDVATLAYVSVLLEEHGRQGGPLMLHVPLAFTSLATQRTRERLIRLTQSVREAMRATVMIEIDRLDGGVPPSRMIEVVGLVRSLCLAVLGRVRPNRAAFAAVRGCGLRGVVADAALLRLGDDQGIPRLKAYATIAREVSPNIVIHSLPRPEMIDDAAAAGFTHASALPERRAKPV